MAVPFRRTGKTRKRKRRTHFKLTSPATVKCSNCGAITKPHRACSKCGFYKGRVVVTRKDEAI